MLQLNLVVVQQSSKEWMGRNHESALVEGREGHDIATRRRRRILATGHEPLHRVGPPTEKTALDEALHACVGDVGAIPRLHGRQGRKNKSYAGGERAKAIDPNAGGREAEKARLWLGVSKDEGKGRYL